MEMREAMTLVLDSPHYCGDLVGILEADNEYLESYSIQFLDDHDNVVTIILSVDFDGHIHMNVERSRIPTDEEFDAAMEAYHDTDDEDPYLPF